MLALFEPVESSVFSLEFKFLHDKEGGNQGKVQEPLEKGALTLFAIGGLSICRRL